MTAPGILGLLAVAALALSGCSGDGGSPVVEPPPEETDGPPTLVWSHRSDPVLRPSASGWDSVPVVAPFVMESAGTYRMWYAGSPDPSAMDRKTSIGYATSNDSVNWQRVGNDRVLAPREDQWNHSFVTRPVVLRDGETLRMWYSGGAHPGDLDIGYATSVDGIHWDRHPQPVLVRGPAGEWTSEVISPGTVIKEDGMFKMWFYADVGFQGPGFWESSTRTGIGYATSPDGITWTPYKDTQTTQAPFEFSDPVLFYGEAGAWDAHLAFEPSVIPTDDGYEMCYTGWTAGGASAIGFATSPDGISWTKHEGNPVLRRPTWVQYIRWPRVLRDDNTYSMWYTVGSVSEELAQLAIGYAIGRWR